MATGRDRVWAAALRVGIETDEFRVDDVLEELGDDAPSRKTIQRTLRGMKETGVVSHAPSSPWYSCIWSTTSGDAEAAEPEPDPDAEDLEGELKEWLADRPPRTSHGKAAAADVITTLLEAAPESVHTSELKDVVYADDGRGAWNSRRGAWESIARYLEEWPGVEKPGSGEWRIDESEAKREFGNNER